LRSDRLSPIGRNVRTFLYRCPTTGFRIQGYSPEQTSDDDGFYEPVTCALCKQVHLVNTATGNVLGERDE
jgi:hypothetical protein